MKKILLAVAACSVLNVAFVVAKAGNIASIDSMIIMQKSEEGKKLTEDIKAKIEEYNALAKKRQDDITALDKEIKEKKDVLSKTALAQKKTKLEEDKQKAGVELATKGDKLRREIQDKQTELREKHLAVLDNWFKKEKYSVVIDKNTPGVIYLADATDITDEVIKRVDAEYKKALDTTKDATKLASAKKSKKSGIVKAA